MDIKHSEVEVREIPDDDVQDCEPFINNEQAEILDKPKRVMGKQPRNWQDRSKYSPHQGKRESERRLRRMQIESGKEARALAEIERIRPALEAFLASTTEDRQDTPAISEV